MKLTAISYELPLHREFRTAGGHFGSRRGLLLRLRDGATTAWGEAAPLPGFSRETLGEVTARAEELGPAIRELFAGQAGRDLLDNFYRGSRVPPSLRFALDTLWTDLESRRRQIAPGELLFGELREKIDLNAVLPLQGDLEVALSLAGELARGGFGTLKVKMGADPAAEIRLLRKIRDRHPDLRLRADANRGWDPERAESALGELGEIGLEYCEEPLAECTPENLGRIRSAGRVPLALDETLSGDDFDRNLLQFTDFFILKPMVLGGLENLFATKALADDHGIGIILSSSLEGGTGRAMTALLAGGLGSAEFAHGLATGSLFETDFTDLRQEEPARLRLTRSPGLPPVDEQILGTIATDHFEL